MCGRTSIQLSPAELIAELRYDPADLVGCYNVAPSVKVPTVRCDRDAEDTSAELHMVSWGFVPCWAKDSSNRSLERSARLALGGCWERA